MNDFFQFLTAIESSHRQFEPAPPLLHNMVRYCCGKMTQEESEYLEGQVAESSELRQRLITTWNVIDQIKASTKTDDWTTNTKSPFELEIFNLWRDEEQDSTPLVETPDSQFLIVGRDWEIQEVMSWIRSGPDSLLVITGIGGVGKTTSLNAIKSRQESHPYSVQLSCTTLISRQDMLRQIARSLGLEFGEEIETTIQQTLLDKPTLLLLDRVDGLPFVGELLSKLIAGTQCKVIATSRTADGLDGLSEYILKPFEDSDFNEDSPSVSLFNQLAKKWFGSLDMSAATKASIRELCKRTQGIPLSISIAAGCLQTHGIDNLTRDFLPQIEQRQSANSVRSSVQSCFRMMSESDRMILQGLMIFTGVFRYDDGRYVTGISDTEFTKALGHLERNSLVVREQVAGRQEFRVTDSVFDYLNELDANAIERFRYQQVFATRASEVDEAMSSGRWKTGTDLLLRDQPNLRKATYTAIEKKQSDQIQIFADGLCRSYFEAGYVSDFETLANAGSALNREELTVRMLGLQGAIASIRGDGPTCRQLWGERIRLAKSLGDIDSWADCVSDLAWQAHEEGNDAEAYDYLEQGEVVCEQHNKQELLASMQVIRVRMLIGSGQIEEARSWIEKINETLERCHDKVLLPFVYQGLARSYIDLGETDNAIHNLRILLKMTAEGRRVIHVARCLSGLAPLYEQKGQVQTALKCYLAAVRVLNEYKTKDFKRISEELDRFCERHEIDPNGSYIKSMNEPWEDVVKSINLQ